MFDADNAFLRQLEIYRNERPGIPLRCYWLMYENSFESHTYFAALEKETEAFRFIIKQSKVQGEEGGLYYDFIYLSIY
jgi:DNA excision repair protein ERCC-4